jgi:hypothetical protein
MFVEDLDVHWEMEMLHEGEQCHVFGCAHCDNSSENKLICISGCTPARNELSLDFAKCHVGTGAISLSVALSANRAQESFMLVSIGLG